MLLTRLIQGLGALSLVHLAIATEAHFPKKNETGESDGPNKVPDGGYDTECFGCCKTKTVTHTKTHTETKTKTQPAVTITYAIPDPVYTDPSDSRAAKPFRPLP
jgi:hypothetical protein